MKFLSDILAKAGLTVDGVVTLNNTATGQTPNANDNSTKLATTAWVRTYVQPYSLPIASASVLGGIKVGSGLSIDAITGILTASATSVSTFRDKEVFTATAGQTTFTLQNTYTPGLLDVFVNGVYLNDDSYTASNGSTVVLDDATALNDIVTFFIYSPYYVGETPNARNTCAFTATSGQTTFSCSYAVGSVDVFYNGSKLASSEFTAINGTSIILATACVAGDYVEIVSWLSGGGILSSRTITIDGVTQDLSANRTWNILPTGGAAGDILAKVSSTNYDVTWIPNFTSTVQHTVKAAVALTKGQAVYVSSADGTNMIVSKASNISEATSSKTLGLVAQNLAINGQGFVVTEGLLAGLNTGTANAGDPVWLGTDGNLIYGLVNKPYAPDHLVFIGVVTRAQQNNGEIFVKVQNGFELHELHNVSALNPSDGDMIKYVASTGLWTKIAATTTNIAEGTNLYYTNTRVASYLTANSYNSGTGTSGQVAYFNGTTSITSTSSFSFNSSESNLTIDRSLSTLGNAITISKGSDANQAWLAFRQGGGGNGTWRLGYTGDPYDFTINVGTDSSIGAQTLRIFEDSQNVVIGTSTIDNGARLQVSGTGVAFNFTTSNGLIGNINSSAANGGYVTWQTSGTTIADLGTAQQVFGAGGSDTFGINARGSRSLILGTNNTARLTLASTGAANFSSSVTANGLNALGSTLNNGNAIRLYRAGLVEMAYIGWTNENSNNSTWYFKSSNGNPIAFSADGTNQQLIIATSGAATFSSNVTTTGGFLQFPNNYGVEGRNAANTAHRTVLKLNTSNQIEIGRDTDISSIILGTASAVNAMTITSNGNVLIGTQTNAGSRLQIEGGNFRFNWENPSASHYVWLNRNSTQDGGILLTKDNTLDWQINNTGSSGDLIFYSYGIGNPALTIVRATGAVIIRNNVRATSGQFDPYSSVGSTASPVFQDAILLGTNANLCKIQYGNEFQSTHGAYIRFQVNSASSQNSPTTALTLFPSGAAAFGSNVSATTVTATNYISGTQGLNVSGYGFLTQTISGQMTVLGHNISANNSVANQVYVVNGGWYSSMIRMYYSEGITFHTSTTVYSAGAVYPMGDTERVRIQLDGQTRFQNSIILTNGQINSLTSGGSGQSMYLNFAGNGAVYAGSSYAVLYAGSDERIKTEINHSQSTLTKILNLIPRTFKYKERPEVTNYGFIAQEVEVVMPELVRTSQGITMCLDEEIENQKSVESYGLAWASILVKAIQEQQLIIESLKSRIETLEQA